jgi:hypothetical protein
MTLENLALLSRRSRLGVAVVILVLIGAAAWTAGHFLQPAAPRHIVLASGLEDANVFRCTPENGHCSTRSACRKRANKRLMHRSKQHP